jgi:hypothetical protein
MGLGKDVGGRQADLGDSEVLRTFVGGVRLNGLDATWPLVRLDLCGSGLRLRPRKVLRRIMPMWEARYPELTNVRASGRLPMVFSGVRFKVSTEDWAIFWTPRPRRVRAALASMGISVDETPIPRPFMDPGGHRETSRL